MREAPGPIPKDLPRIQSVWRVIQRAADRPSTRLADLPIARLVEDLSDGTPAWLTGSTVWMPAVFGRELEGPADFDVIFAEPAACDRFLSGAIALLNQRLPASAGRYTLGNNMFGSGRVLHPDGTGVIDAWSLGEHESIGEVLMTYPYPYQRAAYYLSRNPSPGCVFRIANDGESERARKESVFDKIKLSSASRYPGRRRI